MPLADTKKSKSTDTVGSTATDASSAQLGLSLMVGASNDFVAAKEMVQRDIDLVGQELNRYHQSRGGRSKGALSISRSHRAFFSIDEENPVTHTPQRTGDFEWHGVLQRAVYQPPSTLPALMLLPGATLAQLGRFPRNSEREHVTTVSDANVAEIISGSIYFVSHRWNSEEQPDTADNAQAQLLINWLDEEHGEGGWHHMFFWVDWSSIEQDNDELKTQQIRSLPIYLRCCTYIVCIAWKDYWERSWCGMEAVAFDMTKKRTVLTEGGACDVLDNRAAAQALLVRDASRPHVWDGACQEDEDRQLIMDVMMEILNIDMKQLDSRQALEGVAEDELCTTSSNDAKEKLGDLGALLYTYRRSLQAKTAWVGGVPDASADDHSLRMLFADQAGLQVTQLTIRHKEGQHRNWALVSFFSEKDAVSAQNTVIEAEGDDGKPVALMVRECKVEQQLLERGSALSSGGGQLHSISASHMRSDGREGKRNDVDNDALTVMTA